VDLIHLNKTLGSLEGSESYLKNSKHDGPRVSMDLPMRIDGARSRDWIIMVPSQFETNRQSEMIWAVPGPIKAEIVSQSERTKPQKRSGNKEVSESALQQRSSSNNQPNSDIWVERVISHGGDSIKGEWQTLIVIH
jgi:hypothetical protein